MNIAVLGQRDDGGADIIQQGAAINLAREIGREGIRQRDKTGTGFFQESQHLAQQLAGVIRVHQRRADERDVITEVDDRLHVFERADAALRHRREGRRQRARELSQPRQVDAQGVEIAAIEADQHLLVMRLALGEHFLRDLQIDRVERFDDHEHLQHRGDVQQRLDAAAIQHAHDHEYAAGACGTRLHHLIRIDEEILSELGMDADEPQAVSRTTTAAG